MSKMEAERKRNLLQHAVHHLFAVWLGITPPSPGQELFYGALLLAAALLLLIGGYFGVHLLLGHMLG